MKGAVSLSQGLCMNKSIKILDLSRNVLGAKGCEILCESLSMIHTLKSLDLSYNEIANQGAKAIAKLIPKQQLFELRAQGNKISQDGMIAIFAAMALKEGKKPKTVCQVRILDLSVNIM